MIRKSFFVLCFSFFVTLGACTQVVIPEDYDYIIMQHPMTREVIYCYAGEASPASECADYLEDQGFMRLTDKPSFSGGDDLMQKGSYPTRRYREKQDIPRW